MTIKDVKKKFCTEKRLKCNLNFARRIVCIPLYEF